jgi:hypothetical protein
MNQLEKVVDLILALAFERDKEHVFEIESMTLRFQLGGGRWGWYVRPSQPHTRETTQLFAKTVIDLAQVAKIDDHRQGRYDLRELTRARYMVASVYKDLP